MTNLMQFKIGDVVKPVPGRETIVDMPTEITVAEVFDHGEVIPGISHRYSIKGTNGHTYSGWWFDPSAPEVWDDGPEDFTDYRYGDDR